MAIRHEDKTDYFIRKYEDLYVFYMTLEDELAYELCLSKECVECQGLTRPTKIVMGSIQMVSALNG